MFKSKSKSTITNTVATTTIEGEGVQKGAPFSWTATKNRGLDSTYPYSVVVEVGGDTFTTIAANEADCIQTAKDTVSRVLRNKMLPEVLAGEGTV